MMQTANSNGKKTIYDIGVQELVHVSTDDGARRTVDRELNEARGRETARLHVTLKSLAETDSRSSERARATIEAIERVSSELQDRAAQLSHLIESFEQTTGKNFSGLHDDLRVRAEALTGEITSFKQAEGEHFAAVRTQVGEFRDAVTEQVQAARTDLWQQGDANFQSLATQGRESTEHLSMEVKDLRNELVRLVDSRMNQADASFAALRGDIEVLKYLVMDIIKTRIGRTDPNQKPI